MSFLSTLDSQSCSRIITDVTLEERSAIGRHCVLILEFTLILLCFAMLAPQTPKLVHHQHTVHCHVGCTGHCLKVCRTIRRVLVLLASRESHMVSLLAIQTSIFRRNCYSCFNFSCSPRIRTYKRCGLGRKTTWSLFLDSCSCAAEGSATSVI